MANSGRTDSRSAAHRPPSKIFLGIGVVLFAVNHLSVVLGNGIVPEALVMGSWVVLIGGWVLLACRSFDAVWGWAKRSAWREIGLALLTLAVAIAVAEAVAWFGYGQHLTS
jgi:hypothetical protein